MSKKILSGAGLHLPILLILALIISCNKEESKNDPVIQMITDSNYVYQDSMLKINQKIMVGIQADGDVNLTYLGVTLDADGQVFYLLDSGLYCQSFRYSRLISKAAANVEKWTFTIMDENRKVTSKTLVFRRDPSSGFGEIFYHPSLILGAQDNTDYNHCLALPSGLTFTPDSATAHQGMVDILFYYNPAGGVPPYESTFSSPGENDAPVFYPFISAWTVHNSTYYNPTTTVTLEQFNGCSSDSLLLAAYDESNGKRKFKNTAVGNIIPFKTMAGKIGLMHVKSLESGPGGRVEVEVKVQE